MVAHATISNVAIEQAQAMPGVASVLTAGDLDLPPRPPSGNVDGPFARPLLARDRARFVGEPIAVVLADSLARAEDAAEMVVVDAEPLGAVVGAEAAVAEHAPILFPEAGTNVAHAFEEGWDRDVLEGADAMVRLRVRHQRLAPVPMETNAILAEPREGGLVVWVSTQVPFDVRADLEDWLGLERQAVRVIAPDVGGGFGSKLHVYPEYLVRAAAALRLGRPVRWTESRTESMTNLNHGRAQIHDIELGATRRQARRPARRHPADMGAYPVGAYLPPRPARCCGRLPDPRRRVPWTLGRDDGDARGRVSGAGRPEAALSIERAMDALADGWASIPSAAAAEPHPDRRSRTRRRWGARTTAATTNGRSMRRCGSPGTRSCSGPGGRRACEGPRGTRRGGELLRRGDGLRAQGVRATDVDAGTVTVRVGTSPQGQGHETAFAQLAASVLGVPLESVRVLHSDTGAVRQGEGTYGSRSLQVGGTAVFETATTVLERARRLAAHELEASVEDVTVLEDGRVGVVGAPERSLTWAELATIATDPPGCRRAWSRPRGRDAVLPRAYIPVRRPRRGRRGRPGHGRRSSPPARLGGRLRRSEPGARAGQVHGGPADRPGAVRRVELDEWGTPVTTSLATYAMPAATELPAFETSHTQTPTTVNPLGVKGIGESATIGSTPAVVNAVVDALSYLGVRHVDLPLTPERVWRAIREAEPSR
jgi:carbon-monoxide dehydrogenase large subunit